MKFAGRYKTFNKAKSTISNYFRALFNRSVTRALLRHKIGRYCNEGVKLP